MGFSRPVSGAIFRTARPPCCGVPLGGVATGCVDIDARGVFGYSSIFNESSLHPFDTRGWRMPRKMPAIEPVLGLAVGGSTWVLATEQMVQGGELPWCTDPHDGTKENLTVDCAAIEGVQPVREIHYWGHFPVADMLFETDAPVSVAMRAWSPFIPGNVPASNIPAAVFEVHLQNDSGREQGGTLVFNFPGPDVEEARSTEFTRQPVAEDFNGVLVSSTAGVQYILGVIGDQNARFGTGLHRTSAAWSSIASGLPQARFRDRAGSRLYQESGCSTAVDFALQPGETRETRILLAWYAPVVEGVKKTWTGDGFEGFHTFSWRSSEWAGDTNFYTHMYAARYGGALDIARRMAEEHDGLLECVLAWQEVIYAADELPVWLRDSLVNNLALVAEDSYWFQARPPLGDWAYPDGVFALNESPRGCPQTACIPCDWYGNWPVVFFFSELARTTLRAFKHYQKADGEIPFAIGRFGDLPDMATPEYRWQASLNGMCFVDMVDRLWQRSGDPAVLQEFYSSSKRCTTFTMGLCSGPDNVISMPDMGGMEWFEFGEWAGMAAHLGGLRLAQLRMMERMAKSMGDVGYAQQCGDWFADGSRAMEEELWTGDYYLNFYEKETGKRSDDVMAFQLDGEWTARYHGFDGVFKPERVPTALQTIERCNIALTPGLGAANFARPGGSPLTADSKVAAYGAYTMFSAEVLILAMTYIQAGQEELGLDLARRYWENLVLSQRHAWDLPVMVRGDTGRRLHGTDYYQCMMLWALPAALAGQDLKAYCAAGALVDRIIKAGAKAEA